MYNIEDCILIRKTDIFPQGNIVETPIHGLAYEFGISTVMGDAIYDKLREQYSNPEELTIEARKFNIYFEAYRRTIHFTINGVVPNSIYGEHNYPFAILEPLKHHINDESLTALRVEDTYFQDDMHLSKDSIVLIPEAEAPFLEEKYGFKGMNIRTYTGDIEEAIKGLLEELNYDFFVVNNHGYVKGLDSSTKDAEMYNFIQKYSMEHGISQARHFTSDINSEDQERSRKSRFNAFKLYIRDWFSK